MAIEITFFKRGNKMRKILLILLVLVALSGIAQAKRRVSVWDRPVLITRQVEAKRLRRERFYKYLRMRHKSNYSFTRSKRSGGTRYYRSGN